MKAKFLTGKQRRRLNKHMKKEVDRLLAALEARREETIRPLISPETMDALKGSLNRVAENMRNAVKELAPLGVAMAASMADSAEAEGGDDNGEENNADC